MHENREISCTSWSADQDRSAKAINQTADVHVQEKSDCAVVPMNRLNKEAEASAEVGEGRAQAEENIVQSHMPPTQSEKRMSQGLRGVRQVSNGKEAGTVHCFAPPSKHQPTSGQLSRTQAASIARRRWRHVAGVCNRVGGSITRSAQPSAPWIVSGKSVEASLHPEG
jgi:hypothetical protein